jgi:YfiH family protein
MSGSGELSVELPDGGCVLFTDRSHGNLSLRVGEHHERGFHTRERLRTGLGLRGLVHGRQVHGAVVRQVVEDEAGFAVAVATGRSAGMSAPTERFNAPDAGEADGHATALRGLGVMVLTADCLPVALGAHGAVAIVHAGWRGLAAGVLEQGVRALRELGEDDPVAVIGPGAGACCYEVGGEVHTALGVRRRGRHIDLKAIARERLLAAGVADVRDVGACTICDERFFSHRREGTRAGRQAGLAWLS